MTISRERMQRGIGKLELLMLVAMIGTPAAALRDRLLENGSAGRARRANRRHAAAKPA